MTVYGLLNRIFQCPFRDSRSRVLHGWKHFSWIREMKMQSTEQRPSGTLAKGEHGHQVHGPKKLKSEASSMWHALGEVREGSYRKYAFPLGHACRATEKDTTLSSLNTKVRPRREAVLQTT